MGRVLFVLQTNFNISINSHRPFLPSFRFLITTPPAISSGVRLHTSCAGVHRAEMQQEAAFEAVMLPYARGARVFKHCADRSKSSASQGKVRCACNSLTLRSWLMPAQLHRVVNSHAFQFPDPRLIQYDCGMLLLSPFNQFTKSDLPLIVRIPVLVALL